MNCNEYIKEWRKKHPRYNNLMRKNYYYKNCRKEKEAHKQWCSKNQEHLLEYTKQYRQTKEGKLSYQKANKKYRQTEKGKIMRSKSNAKRKRNLNWIQVFKNPFDESEIIEWHHITDAYVVAIPKDLHEPYGGKLHREKTIEIIKQIYSGE